MKKNITIIILLSVLFFTSSVFQATAQINLLSINNSLSYTGDPGPTTISITLINSGPFVSEPTSIGFYFSLDSVPDPEVDSLIWTIPVPVIGPGDTVIVDTTFDLCGPDLANFPAYVLADTSFYITFIIDPGNTMMESNETDNFGLLLPSLVLGCTLGIDEAGILSPINVYPNPNDGHFTITYPDTWNDKAIAVIEDMVTHDIIYQGTFLSDQNHFDFSFLPAGIYVLRIRYNDHWFTQFVNVGR